MRRCYRDPEAFVVTYSLILHFLDYFHKTVKCTLINKLCMRGKWYITSQQLKRDRIEVLYISLRVLIRLVVGTMKPISIWHDVRDVFLNIQNIGICFYQNLHYLLDFVPTKNLIFNRDVIFLC